MLLIIPLPSAAANITMECGPNVYRYVDNWLKADEVLIRKSGKWTNWCENSVRKEAETPNFIEKTKTTEFEIGDKSGTCTMISKYLSKKYKKQSRLSTPAEWKQRVTDLKLCLNEESLSNGTSCLLDSKNCIIYDGYDFSKPITADCPINNLTRADYTFTPSKYRCWNGCTLTKDQKLEWTKRQLERKGYEYHLKPIRDGVETSEDTSIHVLDFYLKTLNKPVWTEQCKVLQD